MKCWLCTAEFFNKRDLKAHLAGPPHDRMRVICPWCHLEEKCFKKINDLKSMPVGSIDWTLKGCLRIILGNQMGFI
jgi:hypothetical protein